MRARLVSVTAHIRIRKNRHWLKEGFSIVQPHFWLSYIELNLVFRCSRQNKRAYSFLLGEMTWGVCCNMTIMFMYSNLVLFIEDCSKHEWSLFFSRLGKKRNSREGEMIDFRSINRCLEFGVFQRIKRVIIRNIKTSKLPESHQFEICGKYINSKKKEE